MPQRPLEKIPTDTVMQLRSAFSARMDKRLDKNLPQGASDELRAALKAFLQDASRAIYAVPDAALKDLCDSGTVRALGKKTAAVRKQYAPQFEPFSLTQKFRHAAARKWRNDHPRVKKLFGDEKRFYLPLPQQAAVKGDDSVETAVRKYLDGEGYTVTDYVGGYATDKKGKQQFRIGKLLHEHSKLLKRFVDDETRVTQKMMAVISRDEDDIARMSAARGWFSCMDPTATQSSHIAWDIAKGSLITYLVSENDPEIHDPLARILLKPHYRDGETVWLPARAYGLGNEAFATVAADIADTLNAPAKPGLYRLDKKLYVDHDRGKYIHDPENVTAEQLLKDLGLKYSKHGDELFVMGNIDIEGMHLKRLPDLSRVVLMGDFNCRDNLLETMEGAPRKITGSIYCDENRLRTLKGCPAEIGGSFHCGKNKLTTLEGGPSKMSGDYNCVLNNLTSLQGAPEVISGAFLADNNPLETLVGGPREVLFHYRCTGTKLKDLEGAPEKFSAFATPFKWFSSPEELQLHLLLSQPAPRTQGMLRCIIP